MLEHRPAPAHRRSARPPFPHILCAVDGAPDAAIEQAIAVADGDARIVFAGTWYGGGSLERAAASEKRVREAVTAAVWRGREAGVRCEFQLFHAPRPSDALLRLSALH